MDAAVVAMADAAPSVVVDASIAASIAADAHEPPPDAGVSVRVVRPNPKAEQHIKNAEQALHANNVMRQLTQADLALQADPRNARAKFLYGDALIKYGQTDKGCRYLRQIGKKNRVCGSD